MQRSFTLDEVKRHSTASDTWIVLNGAVYDVTAFLKEHPGGIDVLLEHAGEDASVAFDDIGHSNHARELLAKFKIGRLASSSDKEEPPTKSLLLPIALVGSVIALLISIKVFASK